MNIPIVIICYNNYKYVENTLKQIASINKDYYTNIIILNNMMQTKSSKQHEIESVEIR